MSYSRNSYLQYKHSTNELVRWIVTTAPPPPPPPLSSPSNGEPTTTRPATAITVQQLRSLAVHISERVKPIPPRIYTLFQTVIAARRLANAFFQSSVETEADPEVALSNERHRAFIEALEAAYTVLGGEAWKKRQEELKHADKSGGLEVGDGEVEGEEAFVNKFEGLDVEGAASAEEEEPDADVEKTDADVEKTESRKPKPPQQQNKRKKGKGKNKKSKSSTGGAPPPSPKAEPTWEEPPLENYKLLDDDGGVTDVYLALFSFVKDLSEYRFIASELWRLVSLDQQNAAVAGATTLVMIGQVKTLQHAIAADLPAFGPFHAAITTYLRGDPDVAQGKLRLRTADGAVVDVNVKEAHMLHAYADLAAFLADYRKQRNGRPTKAMAARLAAWDPLLDLQRASEVERLAWRSKYTIAWLYDLVNAYACPILTHELGQIRQPEAYDWSSRHENYRRMLWGLEGFAAEVIALAMQKPSASIEAAILPHHVFTLQVAVDAMALARGWKVAPFTGASVLGPPANRRWEDGAAMRHVNLFKRGPRSVHEAAEHYINALHRDALKYDDPKRNEYWVKMIPGLLAEINMVLGDSMLSQPKSNTGPRPDSRFEAAGASANGLWLYSPFLCGAGLAEALGFTYGYAMRAWENTGAPLNTLLHLYNLLQRNSHLPKPIPLLDELTHIYGKRCFAASGGVPPTSDYLKAFSHSVGVKPHVLGVDAQKRRLGRGGDPRPADRQVLREGYGEGGFGERSFLQLLREHEWLPDRVPDEEMPLESALAWNRLQQLRDEHLSQLPPSSPSPSPSSSSSTSKGKRKPPETALVRRYRAAGLLPDDFFTRGKPAPLQLSSGAGEGAPIVVGTTNQGYPEWLLDDVHADVLGLRAPRSGLNPFLLGFKVLYYVEMLFQAVAPLPAAQNLFKRARGAGVRAPIVAHDACITLAFQSILPQQQQGVGGRCDSDALRTLGKKLWELAADDSIVEYTYWDELVASKRESTPREKKNGGLAVAGAGGATGAGVVAAGEGRGGGTVGTGREMAAGGVTGGAGAGTAQGLEKGQGQAELYDLIPEAELD